MINYVIIYFNYVIMSGSSKFASDEIFVIVWIKKMLSLMILHPYRAGVWVGGGFFTPTAVPLNIPGSGKLIAVPKVNPSHIISM